MGDAPAAGPEAGWLLLHNAAAGADDRGVLEAVAGGLAFVAPCEIVATGGRDDVDAALAAADGRVVVVCGGDGSVHLVVERARATGLLDDLVFGVLPLGTGNDLAGHLGIDADPAAAVDRLATSSASPTDLLVTDDDRVVVNAAHVGVGAAAAAEATDLKDTFGRLAYPLGALAAGTSPAAVDVRVTLDGERLDRDEPALLVAVANGSTIGGGTPVAPEARIDDGLLDVVVVHATGPAERAAFAAALVRGTHTQRDDVVVGRGRAVTLHGSALVHDRDGELDVSTATARTYRVAHGAWWLLRNAG